MLNGSGPRGKVLGLLQHFKGVADRYRCHLLPRRGLLESANVLARHIGQRIQDPPAVDVPIPVSSVPSKLRRRASPNARRKLPVPTSVVISDAPGRNELREIGGGDLRALGRRDMAGAVIRVRDGIRLSE